MTYSENLNTEFGPISSAYKASIEAPNSVPQDEEGHYLAAEQADACEPSSSTQSETGYRLAADKARRDVSASEPNDGEDHMSSADKAGQAMPFPSPLIDVLAEFQVRRKFYISVTNKQANAAKALVRRALGQQWSDSEEDREASSARASRIVAAGLAGKPQKAEDAEVAAAVAFDLSVIAAGLEPFRGARDGIELEMKRTVRKLPVYAWAKGVRGLGELGLAVIVGEAGDLGKYPKKGHLWKRFGLAPHEGMAYSTWRMKGGLTAEDWTEAGYSPRRRAEVFAVIADPLFRAQTCAPDGPGPYRLAYDARRELTAGTHPDWTKAHSHADALRIMSKRLLRDLWQAWRAEA